MIKSSKNIMMNQYIFISVQMLVSNEYLSECILSAGQNWRGRGRGRTFSYSAIELDERGRQVLANPK